MSDLVMLGPHDRMTPEECLSHCAMDHENFGDVMVIGYDKDGDLIVRSSAMRRADALFMLMKAVDHAMGRTDG